MLFGLEKGERLLLLQPLYGIFEASDYRAMTQKGM